MSDDVAEALEVTQKTASLGGMAFMMRPTPKFMAAGAALLFGSQVVGFVAQFFARKVPPGPSNADLKRELDRVVGMISALKTQITDLDADVRIEARTQDLIAGQESDMVLDAFIRKVNDAIDVMAEDFDKPPSDIIVSKGTRKSRVLEMVDSFDVDLSNEPQPVYLEACHMVEAYRHRGVQVAALNLYCTTRTQLHTRIQKYLMLYQTAVALEASTDTGNFSAGDVPTNWWDAHVLTAPFEVSLRQGIEFADELLTELKKQFRARLKHVRDLSDDADLPGVKRKKEWLSFTAENHLDKIDETTVDLLLGTPTRMGVVDLWKLTLQTRFDATFPFDRGNKLNPVETIPAFSVGAKYTDVVRAFVHNATPGAEQVIFHGRDNNDGLVFPAPLFAPPPGIAAPEGTEASQVHGLLNPASAYPIITVILVNLTQIPVMPINIDDEHVLRAPPSEQTMADPDDPGSSSVTVWQFSKKANAQAVTSLGLVLISGEMGDLRVDVLPGILRPFAIKTAETPHPHIPSHTIYTVLLYPRSVADQIGLS